MVVPGLRSLSADTQLAVRKKPPKNLRLLKRRLWRGRKLGQQDNRGLSLHPGKERVNDGSHKQLDSRGYQEARGFTQDTGRKERSEDSYGATG